MDLRWGEDGSMDLWTALRAGQVTASERRAVALLARVVDRYRFSLYCVNGELPCRGNVTGNTYFVRKAGGAVEVDGGGRRWYWCIGVGARDGRVAPTRMIPPTDQVVALRALVEGEELAFRETGVRSEFHGFEVTVQTGVVDPYSVPFIDPADCARLGFDSDPNHWLSDEWDWAREQREYVDHLHRDLVDTTARKATNRWHQALARAAVRPSADPFDRLKSRLSAAVGQQNRMALLQPLDWPPADHRGVRVGDRWLRVDERAAQHLQINYGVNVFHELQVFAGRQRSAAARAGAAWTLSTYLTANSAWSNANTVPENDYPLHEQRRSWERFEDWRGYLAARDRRGPMPLIRVNRNGRYEFVR